MGPDPIVLAARLHEPDAGLLAVAAILLAGWYLLLGALTLIRWPRSPDPGPATHDLRPEPPAVANLLTHGWLLTEDSMPATLLDLGARGLVAIEDRGDGEIQCRIERSGDRGSLQDYERQLLEHLESLATNGVVPVGALTTGPKERSKRWWSSFRKAVGEDAKSRGVARELWPKRLTVTMLGLGVPIYLLLESATGFRDSEEVRMTPLLAVVTYGLFGAIFPLGALTGTSRLRETQAGRIAAAHWLGVRENLENLPSFPDLPPDAVVTWERHLAYGAALGVAGRAVKSLPLGAEHDKRAWTDYGGHWKQVTIRYPRLRPGWGLHPGLALLLGLLRTAVVVGIFWFASSFDLLRADTYGPQAPIWTRLLLGLIPLVLLAIAGFSIANVLEALLDIGRGSIVEGEVLRTRIRGSRSDEGRKLFFVAVYTGVGDKVDAWRVSAKKYPYFYQGQTVRVEVSPRLKHVRIPE